MTMLTDAEQRQLNDDLLDGPTTQKINKKLSEAEERILKQLAPVVKTVQDHESLITLFRRRLGVKSKTHI